MATTHERVALKWFGQAFVLTVSLYVVNYLVTPLIVSDTDLELYFRPTYHRPFSSEDWRQATTSTGVRYLMVDDLLSTGALMGRSPDAVGALLGAPRERDGVQKVGDDLSYRYTLGSQKSFPAHSVLFPWRIGNAEVWTLVVHFKRSEVVAAHIEVD